VLQVAVLYGQPVFKVTATKLIKPSATFDAGERRCACVNLLAMASQATPNPEQQRLHKMVVLPALTAIAQGIHVRVFAPLSLSYNSQLIPADGLHVI
jgi:hypothetical protein